MNLIHKFAGALLFLAILSTSLSQAQQCSKVRVRREIHDLSPAEIRRFTDAIKQMHSKRDGRNNWSVFERMAKQHNDYAGLNHNSASFFPYHRKLLMEFEDELQTIDPAVTLPYWNWTLYSQNPWNDPVLHTHILGDDNRGRCNDVGCCIGSQGNLPNWSYSKFWRGSPSGCIRRRYTPHVANNQSVFYIWGAVMDLINKSDDYDDFRTTYEIYHGVPHVFIGGGMDTMWSPMDPLFWVHHAFVDLTWETFQKRHDTSFENYNGKRGDGHEVSLSDPLTPYPETAADVMNNIALCVQYAPTRSNGNQSVSTNITAPKLDDSWLSRNGFNASEAAKAQQQSELSINKFQDKIRAAIDSGGAFVPGVGRVISRKANAGISMLSQSVGSVFLSSALVTLISFFTIF